MQNQSGFLVKLFLISALISALINYVAPYLSISATTTNALIIVLLPIAVVAIALLWRFQAYKQS